MVLVLVITMVATTFVLEMRDVMKESFLTAWMVPKCPPGSTPTFTPTSYEKTFLVHAENPYYRDDPTPERIYHGVLKRSARYPLLLEFYLELDNGKVLQIAWGDQWDNIFDEILGSLPGRWVEIRGKLVSLDQRIGVEKQMWVGGITLK
jgi:hypothetical protein